MLGFDLGGWGAFSLQNIHTGHGLHISDQATSFLAAHPMYFPGEGSKKENPQDKKRLLIYTLELKPDAEVFFSIMQATPDMDFSL